MPTAQDISKMTNGEMGVYITFPSKPDSNGVATPRSEARRSACVSIA